jgi:hypothetical protein
MARKSIAEIEARRVAENPVPAADAVVSFPRGLTLPRASEYSGLTVWMLRTLVWDRTIPSQMHGQRIIILREDLDKYLTESKRKLAYIKPRQKKVAA